MENHKDHGRIVAKIHLDLYENDKVHSHIEGNGQHLAELLANALDDQTFRKILTLALIATKAAKQQEQQQTQAQAKTVN